MRRYACNQCLHFACAISTDLHHLVTKPLCPMGKATAVWTTEAV